MPMIRDEHIDETMNEWPLQWFGRSRQAVTYGPKILHFIRELWRMTEQENLNDPGRELHFRALWVMGFELSRDSLLSKDLPKLPVAGRIKSMIEDAGPLLFAFYTELEEDQFAYCCQTFERVLRRSGLWDQYSQAFLSN